METIDKAINLAIREFKKEYGADAEFEDDDEFVTIFNDGVLILSKENSALGVKIILGKPCKVDFSFGLAEEVTK